MSMQRRKFLQMAGIASAGVAFSNIGGINILEEMLENHARKIKRYGLQLWSVRDALSKDPKGVLKDLAAYGYKYVESFEGQQGMFWGMTNTDFKKYISDLGMTMHSAHCNVDDNLDKKAADAAAIGLKYLIMAWEGPGKTIEDYKKMTDKFNKHGETCKKHGIRFAFHNHDFTFKQMEGQYAQDILMNGTDPAIVDYEMDIYWVAITGQDPEAWLKKYPNRFRLSHVKDMARNLKVGSNDNSVDLGTGSINYSQVLKTAKENGMQYFVVEQEAYPNGTSMQAAQSNAGFMKKLRM
jgi:sugar phosphate isomerase/epimerase